MIIGEEYIVEIEKMLNQGLALARINNIPVFVSGACPKDKLQIKITHINKNYLTAEIVKIIEPSPYRIKPECVFHNICGSCDWLHISYDEQINQKRIIVDETLKKIAGNDVQVQNVIQSPKIKEYRCKIQLPVSQTKVSGRILSGYYKKNTHELINIKYCPMQPQIINEINEYIKTEAQKLEITAYSEKTHKGLLRHIVYRISSDLNQILIIFVINSNNIDKKLTALSKSIIEKFPVVSGVCANLNVQKSNVIMSNNTKNIIGTDYYIEKLSEVNYKISANSFFQVNPLCAELIFNKVKELILSKITNPTILDAYSGVSSFGIWLSSIASKVVCIEEVKSASEDARANVKLNKIDNIEIINGDAEVEFDKLIKKGIKFDISITDPPRKGCSSNSINNLIKITEKFIIYVSCNVSTLARDMKILNENGFKAIYIQPVDMFPNTYHVETIVMFERI